MLECGVIRTKANPMAPRFLRERISTTPLLRKLAGNTAWLFADRLLRLGLGLVIGVWLSRYLGPEQFGLYSYLLAFVAIFTPLASLGLDQIVVRELVAGRPAPLTLGTAFVLRLAGGLAVLLLATLSMWLLAPADDGRALLVALIAAGVVVQACDVIDLWFQAQTQARYAVYARGAAFLLASALRVALIVAQAPLAAFLWVNLAELLLSGVALAVALQTRGMPLRSWRFQPGEARRLLGASWPLLFSGLAVMVYMKVDLVMLTQMRGAGEAGVYAAALRLSEAWYFIPMAITTSVTPTIMAARGEPGVYYGRLERLSRLLVRVALLIALPLSLFATPLITAIYGSAYEAAGPVLAVHIWAALFVFLGVAQGPWDVGEDLTRLALYRTAGGAVANVLLNLWLIPGLGALGAALATAASYACSAWLLNLCHPRTRPIFLMQARALNPLAGLARPRHGAPPPGEAP